MPEPLFFGALLDAEADFETLLELEDVPFVLFFEPPDFDFDFDFDLAFAFAPDFDRPRVAAIATSSPKKL